MPEHALEEARAGCRIGQRRFISDRQIGQGLDQRLCE
jgi:hypothetical protein